MTDPTADPRAAPLTVPALLKARAETRGHHPFLVSDDLVLTYAGAAARSAALAKGLISWGIGPGAHVGLLYPNGPQFTVAWLAAARIGAVIVPLSTFSTGAELRTLLRNGEQLVLTVIIPVLLLAAFSQ